MEKQLTPAEWGHIYDLIENLMEIIEYDDTGVTDDLIEKTMVVAEILHITPENGEEDE